MSDVVRRWQDDLSTEKSLWDAFRVARDFKKPKFNVRLRRMLYPAIFVVTAGVQEIYLDKVDLVAPINVLSDFLILFGGTILGFLLTGLAVFITLSDRNVLTVLADTRQNGEEVSSFKYLFYSLLSVFVVFIALVVLGLACKAAASLKVGLPVLLFGRLNIHAYAVLNVIILSILSIFAAEGILRVKSFVWTVYQTFISILTVGDFLKAVEERSSKAELPKTRSPREADPVH